MRLGCKVVVGRLNDLDCDEVEEREITSFDLSKLVFLLATEARIEPANFGLRGC